MSTPDRDQRQRFLFEHSDIRGEILSLESSYQTTLSKANYPPAIARLLGEFLAGACLLSGTLKNRRRDCSWKSRCRMVL